MRARVEHASGIGGGAAAVGQYLTDQFSSFELPCYDYNCT